MPTVLCICHKCGKQFYAKDLYSPASSSLYKTFKSDKEPTTWDEWLLHSASFCEDCRMKEIPESCISDYNKRKGR